MEREAHMKDGGFYTSYLKQHGLRKTLCIMKPTGASSSYYELPPNCEQLLDIIVAKDMRFIQGEIFKAIYRWDAKPDLEYNLRKIKYFSDYLLKRLYASDPENPRHERK